MRYTVLRPFPLSRDGITIEHIAAGPAPDDIPAELVPGLVEAGFLEEENADAGSADDPGTNLIPDGWRDLHHNKIIALAKQIGADVSTKDEAVAAIDAHLQGAGA